MLVAGGFCYGMLLDESRIACESQNSPAPARASDRLLSIWGFLSPQHQARMSGANVRRRGMGSPEPWAPCSSSPHDAPYEEIAAGVIGLFNLDRGG